MPFAPRFVEAGEAEIVDKLMAVVDRDMKAALDYFYPAPSLPDFALKTDGEVSMFTHPLLALDVERMSSSVTPEIDEDEVTFLSQDLRVGAGIVVGSTESLKDARSKTRKYIRAFKAILRAASTSDLLPTTARVTNHSIDIDHRYLRHGTKGDLFVQPVEFEIRIQFGET